jgi:ABC-type branched-subunit amino acid transport system permease subunit
MTRPSLLSAWLPAVVLAVVGLGSPSGTRYVCLGVSLFLAGLGLVVVAGWSRQANLGQYAFLGVGAYGAALVHGPFPLKAAAAMAAAALVAVPVGLAATRLRGLALGALTLLVGLTVWTLAGTPEVLRVAGGDTFQGVGVARPSLLHGGRALAIAALVLAVVALAAVEWLRRSRTGRAIAALATTRPALAASGWDTRWLVVCAFAISAALAGLGGLVMATTYGSVNASDLVPFNSLVLYAFVMNAGADRTAAAAIAATAVPVAAALGIGGEVLAIASGLALVLAGTFVPQGFLVMQEERVAGRRDRAEAEAEVMAESAAP